MDQGVNTMFPEAVQSSRAGSVFKQMSVESTGTASFTLFAPIGARPTSQPSTRRQRRGGPAEDCTLSHEVLTLPPEPISPRQFHSLHFVQRATCVYARKGYKTQLCAVSLLETTTIMHCTLWLRPTYIVRHRWLHASESLRSKD